MLYSLWAASSELFCDNIQNEPMKKLLSILLFTLSIANIFGQSDLQTTKTTEKSFPTNLNQENFKAVKNFAGKIVAFTGAIEQVENSRNNTPFYKLRLDSNDYLWTVLMFKNETNKVGDSIRVAGYVRPVSEPNESEKKYLDGEYMIIAFGLVDFKNSNFLFAGGAERQKQEWIDGKIPSSK